MLWISIKFRVSSFLKEAGKLITIVVICIWALLSFPYGSTPEQSILGRSAKVASPLFYPLGFGHSWQATAAILPGFLAKEAVVGALASSYGIEESEQQEPPSTSFIIGFVQQGVLLKNATIDSLKKMFSSFTLSTFSIEESHDSRLFQKIKQTLTPLSAFSFMVFNLLLLSCVGVMGAMIQEFGKKYLFFAITFTTTTAYAVTWIFYSLGTFLGF